MQGVTMCGASYLVYGHLSVCLTVHVPSENDENYAERINIKED